MIRMALTGEMGLCILEPGNLRRLREGDPIRLDLRQFGLQGELMIAFTNDIEWMELEIKKQMPIASDSLAKLLEKGITLKPVDRGKKAN